jgi:hypothetical protein
VSYSDEKLCLTQFDIYEMLKYLVFFIKQRPGSRVGGQVGGGFPGTGDRQQTPPADPDKIKLIQQHLGLLFKGLTKIQACQLYQLNFVS